MRFLGWLLLLCVLHLLLFLGCLTKPLDMLETKKTWEPMTNLRGEYIGFAVHRLG